MKTFVINLVKGNNRLGKRKCKELILLKITNVKSFEKVENLYIKNWKYSLVQISQYICTLRISLIQIFCLYREIVVGLFLKCLNTFKISPSSMINEDEKHV